MNSHHGDPTVYTQAHTLHAHGIRVIPVRADGSKAPALKAWQQHRVTALALLRRSARRLPQLAISGSCPEWCLRQAGGICRVAK